MLSPLATRWHAELPVEARPDMLVALFPEIVNKLALAWPEAAKVRALLDDLVIDRRGGRSGFPSSVCTELLRLHALVSETISDTAAQDTWF